MRRIAILLRIHRTTVARKLAFLAERAWIAHREFLNGLGEHSVHGFQFDEMETSEHTKLKPLSIALAVTDPERKILGFKVSIMPASGHLAAKSRRKYGPRPDHRAQGLNELFKSIAPVLAPCAVIGSDEKPLYPPIVRKHLPYSLHRREKGRRGCVVGQGELKRGGFDPLFSLNHTAAMIRANINRLFRRTWCTTKKAERLVQHLILYVNYHNQVLT